MISVLLLWLVPVSFTDSTRSAGTNGVESAPWPTVPVRKAMAETNVFPAKADLSKINTDADGLSDCDQGYVYGADPRTPDTDGDGLNDADESALGYNPMNADSDGDGLSDLLDSKGISIASDPLEISRVLDGYAVDDASYVPTAVISNNAVLVTTRLDLPEGAAPVGTIVSVAGKMIPILNGVTFSHSVALVPDSDNLIKYAPSNLPAGSTVTIEIGAHRFAVLDDPGGIVTRFYSIGAEEGR